MKRSCIVLLLLFFTGNLVSAQEPLSDLLNRFNTESVPYISVQELAMPKSDAIILDAREVSEYEISHIEDAIHVGYNDFNLSKTVSKIKDKSAMIVVYCSLGIRSETIANKLKSQGYRNVFNLYGGIFEWKNNDFTVYDSEEKVTENVDAFSKYWSQWLLKGNKVYSVDE